MTDDHKSLDEIGEKVLVSQLIRGLRPAPDLLDGFGHDAGFVKFTLLDNELLIVNTDRSGENIAFKLGLAGPEAIGDLAVSHAVSDIIAAGGVPKLLTVSLLLPGEKTLGYAKRLMKGIEVAANRWGIIIVSGDTKKNPSVSIVVTVIGTTTSSRRQTRSGARAGDIAVVTGSLGTMFTATLAFKSGQSIPRHLLDVFQKSLVHQHPPIDLGLAISMAEIANACTDISDGLPSSIFDMCNSSCVGIELNLDSVPIDKDVQDFASSHLSINRETLVAANGDWQYLYSIPEDNMEEALSIAKIVRTPITAIGKFTVNKEVTMKDSVGLRRHLNPIQNEGFSNRNGQSYFDMLAQNPPLLGNICGE